jgi:hypothetical protein
VVEVQNESGGALPVWLVASARFVARLVRRLGWRRLHLAIVVLSMAVLFYFVQKQWFTLDEFDYLTSPTPWGIIAPHNEHTIVFTKLWYHLCFALFGLRHYWIYAIPMLLAHLAAYIAIVKIVILAIGDRPVARYATLPVLMMGAGAGTLTWGGQFQYTGAVAAGLWLIWLTLRRSRAPFIVVVAVSAVGTLSGSAFIAFGIAAAVLLLLRDRFLAGVVAAAIPAGWFLLVRVVWHVHDAYGAAGISDVVRRGPGYALALLTRAIDDTILMSGFTPAILLAAAAAVLFLGIRRGLIWRRLATQAVAVLALALALSLLVTVVGRLGKFTGVVDGGGYDYFIIAALAPLLLILIVKVVGGRRGPTAAATALAGVLTLASVVSLHVQADDLASWKRDGATALMQTAYLAAHGVTAPDAAVPTAAAPTATWSRIAGWAKAGELDTVKPDSDQRSALLAQLRTATHVVAVGCGADEGVLLSHAGSRHFNGGARVTVSATDATTLSVSLIESGTGARTVDVPASSDMTITSTGGGLRVSLTAGTARVCTG